MDNNQQQQQRPKEDKETEASSCSGGPPSSSSSSSGGYEERIAEILRRTDVVAAAAAAAAAEETSAGQQQQQQHVSAEPLPSKNNYKYVLLNKANAGLNPHSKNPAVRILGFFRSREEIDAYVAEAKRNRVDIALTLGDVHMAERMKWVLVSNTTTRDRDEIYVTEKINQLKALYYKERQTANEDFNRSKKGGGGSGGKMGATLERQRERQQAAAKKKHQKSSKIEALGLRAKLPPPSAEEGKALSSQKKDDSGDDYHHLVGTVPRSLELRRQSYAVVSIMKDYTRPVMRLKDLPEPAVLFIDCFDTVDDAQVYIKDTLAKYIHMMDMDIVEMYEWIYIEAMNPEKLPPEAEMWRDPEQTSIMQHRKHEQQMIARQTSDSRGVTELVSNGLTAEGPTYFSPNNAGPQGEMTVIPSSSSSSAAAAAGESLLPPTDGEEDE